MRQERASINAFFTKYVVSSRPHKPMTGLCRSDQPIQRYGLIVSYAIFDKEFWWGLDCLRDPTRLLYRHAEAGFVEAVAFRREAGRNV